MHTNELIESVRIYSKSGYSFEENRFDANTYELALLAAGAARDAAEKRFAPGTAVLGLAEGGLGLAPVRVDFPGKSEALAKVEALRRAIVEGRLRPPATLAELERFVPPRPQP